MDEKQLIGQILAIERELNKRRKNNRIMLYNSGEKAHEKQIEFHKCNKRNRWVFGGNRSGKTECGAVEAVWMLRGIHPYRKNKRSVVGWSVSLSYKVQREVAQAKILYYLNPDWIEDIVMTSGKKESAEYGIIDYITVRNVSGELSKICFKSCEQGREKFQGASLDFVWFDEEPPQDIYEECRMRVMDKRGDIWGTMTPLKGLTWVYDMIYLNRGGDSQIWHISMEWADNPYLDSEEISQLSASMSKDALESRRYGRFSEAEGIVYGEFDESRHVVEPFDVPFEWQDKISIDPGLHNPLACLFAAVDWDNKIYIVGEHYEAGKSVDYHAEKIFELANKLNWHTDAKGRLEGLVDSAATQRTLASQKSVAELFYERGIILNTKVNKELFAGIARVKSYFRQDRLFIFSTCRNLIRELKSYWWGKGDTPLKKDDHALDALRYYVMSRPQPAKKSEDVLSCVAQDKLKLIRRNNGARL
ncbi:MAG: terminase family protein [Clostridia bacterium]|nr:terminase family protein [Clostridia bacterium]